MEAQYRPILWRTLWLSTATSALCVILAVPCAMVMSCPWERKRNRVRVCARKFPIMLLTGARRDLSDAGNVFALFAGRIGMAISQPGMPSRV